MNDIIEREIETTMRLFLRQLDELPKEMDSHSLSVIASNQIAGLFRTVCILTGSIDDAVEVEREFVSRIAELGDRFQGVV